MSRCTCHDMIYEAGCGYGHYDGGLCEACERELEEEERQEAAERLYEAHLYGEPMTMDEALELDRIKLEALLADAEGDQP